MLAMLLVAAQALCSWAAIDLIEFTATTQADGTILLRWVTRTELDTSSFRIYRAEAANGPWDTIIAEQDSKSDGVSEAVYEHNDAEVAVGTTYYYLLEEVEVESSGGINQYVDFIRSATAGPPGAPTATPTATRTATWTIAPEISPTPSRTPSPTPSRIATQVNVAAATRTPTAPPPPAAQPTMTATPQRQASPTAAPTATAPTADRRTPTATPLPPGRVATPTGRAGVNPTPTAPATARPNGTAQPSPGIASATPPAKPTPTARPDPQRAHTATPSPLIFAAKATEQPALRGAATRPIPAASERETASRDDGWFLMLGSGAVILAAMLGGIAIFLWRRHRA